MGQVVQTKRDSGQQTNEPRSALENRGAALRGGRKTPETVEELRAAIAIAETELRQTRDNAANREAHLVFYLAGAELNVKTSSADVANSPRLPFGQFAKTKKMAQLSLALAQDIAEARRSELETWPGRLKQMNAQSNQLSTEAEESLAAARLATNPVDERKYLAAALKQLYSAKEVYMHQTLSVRGFRAVPLASE